MFDPRAPLSLIEKQRWFASLITSPFHREGTLALPSFAENYVSPSPTLTPHERLEIYHQQYWRRLLRGLQENFPFLTTLFGKTSFDETVGIPYLLTHPPAHWGLLRLGERLQEYLERHYREGDRELVLAAAEIDWTLQLSFFAPANFPLDFSQGEMVTKKMALQPHLHLLTYPADLLTFREKVMAEEERSPPSLQELERRHCYFVIYRSPQKCVKWKELSSAEFSLLSQFRRGVSIEEACVSLEEEYIQEAEGMIAVWFHEWTHLAFLYIVD